MASRQGTPGEVTIVGAILFPLACGQHNSFVGEGNISSCIIIIGTIDTTTCTTVVCTTVVLCTADSTKVLVVSSCALMSVVLLP